MKFTNTLVLIALFVASTEAIKLRSMGMLKQDDDAANEAEANEGGDEAGAAEEEGQGHEEHEGHEEGDHEGHEEGDTDEEGEANADQDLA